MLEHLPPSVAQVKIYWSHVSSLRIRLLDVDRSNFAYTLNFDL
jgi:hypothetical protein